VIDEKKGKLARTGLPSTEGRTIKKTEARRFHMLVIGAI
jgi:hypothetical protein